MNWTVKKRKVNLINLSQNEGLCPSGIALSFDGFGLISLHYDFVFIRRLFHSIHFFRISNFFDLSITEETWVVKMYIWWIKIGNVLVLHWSVQGAKRRGHSNLWHNRHFEANTCNLLKTFHCARMFFTLRSNWYSSLSLPDTVQYVFPL
jgi:hypothetical protein